MEVKIFNVEHGSCAMAFTNCGCTIVFDCGHNSSESNFWSVQTELNSREIDHIDRFVVSHAHEDHLSGLPYVSAPICVLSSHNEITAPVLRILCTKPFGSGVKRYIQLRERMTSPRSQTFQSGVEIHSYRIPLSASTDLNNTSLITFLFYGEFGIVFPGDVEESGWNWHLQDGNFRSSLSRVNVFVASHHGRKNGYNSSIFNYCTSTDVVVFSDTNHKYDTQKTTSLYSQHANGITFNSGKVRYVLTTRNDGNISFIIPSTGGWSFRIGN